MLFRRRRTHRSEVAGPLDAARPQVRQRRRYGPDRGIAARQRDVAQVRDVHRSRRILRPAPRHPRSPHRCRSRCRRTQLDHALTVGKAAFWPSPRQCGHGGAGRPRAARRVSAHRRGGTQGAHRRRAGSASTPYISANVGWIARTPSSVSTLPMSPMCCDIHASTPDARQNVFFNSPPTATTGAVSNGGERVTGRNPASAGSVARDRRPRATPSRLAMDVNRTVEAFRRAGDPSETPTRIGVVVADRFVGEIAAGHHDVGVSSRHPVPA